MEADSIVARAKRGAELLDEVLPGWADHINLDEFDMKSCCDCALGQLFGEYMEGRNRLGVQAPVELGFDLPVLCPGERDVRFSALTTAWVAEIEARRANAVALR